MRFQKKQSTDYSLDFNQIHYLWRDPMRPWFFAFILVAVYFFFVFPVIAKLGAWNPSMEPYLKWGTTITSFSVIGVALYCCVYGPDRYFGFINSQFDDEIISLRKQLRALQELQPNVSDTRLVKNKDNFILTGPNEEARQMAFTSGFSWDQEKQQWSTGSVEAAMKLAKFANKPLIRKWKRKLEKAISKQTLSHAFDDMAPLDFADYDEGEEE